MIDFPVATTVGETFDAGGVTWTWNGTGWTSGGGGGAAQDIWVYRAGDTMTGDLIMAPPSKNSAIGLIKPASGMASAISGSLNGVMRWGMSLGDETAESGSASGSDFTLHRYDNLGGLLGGGDPTLRISRSNGEVGFVAAIFTIKAAPITPAAVFYGLGLSYLGGGTQHGLALRPQADDGVAVNIFNAANVSVGNISFSATTTSYNTTSDQRLKQDLQAFDAGSMIDATNVYDFQWKETGTRSHGVIAQEAIVTYPEAVTYREDQDWYGIDYSKYVPILLQELKALRARVAQLEAGA